MNQEQLWHHDHTLQIKPESNGHMVFPQQQQQQQQQQQNMAPLEKIPSPKNNVYSPINQHVQLNNTYYTSQQNQGYNNMYNNSNFMPQQMHLQNLPPHIQPFSQPMPNNIQLLPPQHQHQQQHQHWFLPATSSTGFTSSDSLINSQSTPHSTTSSNYSNSNFTSGYPSTDFNSDDTKSIPISSTYHSGPLQTIPMNTIRTNSHPHNHIDTGVLSLQPGEDPSYYKPRTSGSSGSSSPASDRSTSSPSLQSTTNVNNENGESPSSVKNSKVRRSRMGCLTCRHRKKRCCENRPKCTECDRLGLNCTWPAPGSEHRNKSKIARLNDGYYYDSFYGNIKILRGVVESRVD
ncbi:hypothetical protein WICPIJ_007895 [Wickerhamomyces pijperi]|uniref:Zn(2)-C6 fungal-type domain-containing protein n=1 Tax=Wickerhamomyces pijperi TaxID=599730 RepID=A0A9P8PZD0_WICPI|nr:hypothetical protein WICPIJ_007895 [Wickerhamomyces pijperi]